MILTIEPGTIYAHLDDALTAASCLCHLAPAGATIYGTTDPALADPASGEAYVIAIDVVQRGGAAWSVPTGGQWEPVYTLTRGKPSPPATVDAPAKVGRAVKGQGVPADRGSGRAQHWAGTP
jgi:hypothetical protein